MTNCISLPQTELTLLREVLYFLAPDGDERQVYLVGGAVRDRLSQSEQMLDLDLAVNFDPMPAARRYAKKYKAGFVILDDERQVVRLVRAVDQSHYTIDITRFRAASIALDLKARDFTINAISVPLIQPLQSPEVELYDPLNGVEHLRDKLIKPCSDELFIDDPLRIMRAFRFAALYGAKLSDHLISLIKRHVKLLAKVSGERIRDELFKILEVDHSTQWVTQLDETGVLQIVLPELYNCHAVEQNEWHHLDVFDHSVLCLKNLEQIFDNPPDEPWTERFFNYLYEIISVPRNFKQLLKFACLLHDIGKPRCKKFDKESQRFIFHGHEMLGMQMSKKICERLRLSTSEVHFIQKVIKNHMRPGVMLQQGISDKRLFRYYSETGRDGVAIAILSLADRLSALGSFDENEIVEFKSGIYQIISKFYLQMDKPRKTPLLKGSDLIKELAIKPGPIFKVILQSLEESQFLGEISTREEALEHARSIIADSANE